MSHVDSPPHVRRLNFNSLPEDFWSSACQCLWGTRDSSPAEGAPLGRFMERVIEAGAAGAIEAVAYASNPWGGHIAVAVLAVDVDAWKAWRAESEAKWESWSDEREDALAQWFAEREEEGEEYEVCCRCAGRCER